MPRLSEILPAAEEWAKRYSENYPQARDVVGLHIEVLRVQARWEDRLLPILPRNPDLFIEAVREGKVFIEEAGIPVEPSLSSLFNDIVSTVAFYESEDIAVAEVSEAARRLLEAMTSGRVNPLTIVGDVLRRGEEAARGYAEAAGIAEEYFNTFMFWTLQPVLHAYALLNADERLRGVDWRETLCPLCGSPTRTGFIEEGGSAYLKCPACGLEWRVERGRCPWCGSREVEELRPIKGIKWLVISVCGSCGRYLRLVDEGAPDERGLRPPRWLYELASTPLDEAYKLMRELLGGEEQVGLDMDERGRLEDSG